jgi:hypothetical protein
MTMATLDAMRAPRRALRQSFRARRTATANDNGGGGTANVLPDLGLLARAGTPGLALRHALALLADDPALRSPGAALSRLKPLVAAERAALAQARGAVRISYASGHARLVDAAVVGLLELARAYVGWGGWSDAAPLAAVAVGEYAGATLAPGAAPELLFVVPDANAGAGIAARDPGSRERRSGERMAAFAMIGFADLGLELRCSVRSIAEHAALAAHTPVPEAPPPRRFIWGRYDLFAGLAEAFPAPASQAGVDAAGAEP